MKIFRIFLIITATSFFFLFEIYIVILDIYFCKKYINNSRQYNLQLSLYVYCKLTTSKLLLQYHGYIVLFLHFKSICQLIVLQAR